MSQNAILSKDLVARGLYIEEDDHHIMLLGPGPGGVSDGNQASPARPPPGDHLILILEHDKDKTER